MSKQPPKQQPPPEVKLQLRYTKTGRARFASHRDFSRAFERALRRAEIPMAYSSGFTPHPRISYAGAAPTGSASEAEYLEIGLAKNLPMSAVQERLNQHFPEGFSVAAIRIAPETKITAELEASTWLLQGENTGLEVEHFLAAESLLVCRETKKGLKEIELRPAIVDLHRVHDRELQLVLRHGASTVRPDDVISALARVSQVEKPLLLQYRMAQGQLKNGVVRNLF